MDPTGSATRHLLGDVRWCIFLIMVIPLSYVAFIVAQVLADRAVRHRRSDCEQLPLLVRVVNVTYILPR